MKTLLNNFKKILVSKFLNNYTKAINKLNNDTNNSENNNVFESKLKSNVSKTNKVIKNSRDKDECCLIMKVSATENITSNQLESFRKNEDFQNQFTNLCWNTKIIGKMNQ